MLFARKLYAQPYSSTSMVNDSNLYLSLSANATYIFDAFLSFSDPAVTGQSPVISFTAPAGCTLKYGVNCAYSTPTTAWGTVVTGSGTSSHTQNINSGWNTEETFVYVKGIVVTGATGGNLQLRCARFGSGSSVYVQLSANSYMTATRVQ